MWILFYTKKSGLSDTCTINDLHIKQQHMKLSFTLKTSRKFYVLGENHKGILCIFKLSMGRGINISPFIWIF